MVAPSLDDTPNRSAPHACSVRTGADHGSEGKDIDDGTIMTDQKKGSGGMKTIKATL